MFTHEDLVKFYLLYSHYDIASNNIAVIDRDKFNRIFRLIKKECKNKVNTRLILNETKTKFTIIENELETTYVYIETPQDLRGRFFRKYI